MRKYLLGLTAIIIAISLSAFTGIKKPDFSENASSSYWFEYNATTGKTGIYLDFGERDDFIAGQCHATSGPDCRRGYPLTALKNQTDPEAGVIDGDLFDQRIRKHVIF